MKRNTIISVCFFALFTVAISYLTYMATQGLLGLISQLGNVVLPYLAQVLLVFLLPSVVVFGYEILFNRSKLNRTFFLKNGYYLTGLGGIAFILALIITVTYPNFGKAGPTLLYPFDMLFAVLLSLALGVCALVLGYKSEKSEGEKIKWANLKKALLYLFVYLALDRFGAFLSSAFSGVGKELPYLLLPYVLLIVPIASLVCYAVYGYLKEEKKSLFLVISASVLAFLALTSSIYMAVALHSDIATPFMKMISPFFGLDRLASLPATMILANGASVFYPVGALALFFVNKKKA